MEKSMMKPRRRASVAPGAPVPVELVSTPAEGPLIVRWLGDIRGMLVHWGKKASSACPGPEECPTAVHRSKTYWKGFAAAEYWRAGQYQDWAPCVYEVTEHLFEQLEGSELRGTVWTVRREIGRGGLKEVTGEMTGEVNPDYLRTAFPIEPVVYRVYRSTHILLDVLPLMPRRLVLPASAGAAPRNMAAAAAAASAPVSDVADKISAAILDGTLSPELRLAIPRLIARKEAELKAKGWQGPASTPVPAGVEEEPPA
jgi:hypothetical protein